MKVIALYSLALLLGSVHGLRDRYVFEFGQNYGNIINELNGDIPLLQSITEKYIPVPPNHQITYIKVVVNSISPPKVDFDTNNNLVTIMFSWTQISRSSYSILVKGVLTDVMV